MQLFLGTQLQTKDGQQALPAAMEAKGLAVQGRIVVRQGQDVYATAFGLGHQGGG